MNEKYVELYDSFLTKILVDIRDGMRGPEKVILCILAKIDDNAGKVYIDAKEIAADLNMSKVQTERHIKELTERGYIEKVKPHFYKILFEYRKYDKYTMGNTNRFA
jgi:DNA-binding MarR family transcriptional regulator